MSWSAVNQSFATTPSPVGIEGLVARAVLAGLGASDFGLKALVRRSSLRVPFALLSCIFEPLRFSIARSARSSAPRSRMSSV